MEETIKVNVLGNTPREQWDMAVHIYSLVVKSNIDYAISHIEKPLKAYDALNKAVEMLDDFANEMHRLAENIDSERYGVKRWYEEVWSKKTGWKGLKAEDAIEMFVRAYEEE